MLRGRRRRRSVDAVYGESFSPSHDREPLPEPPEKSLQQLQSIRSKVRQSSLLQNIDERRLTAAIRHMTLREVRAGEIIFRQDDPGDHFYLVEEGRFDMYERDDYEEDELGGISRSYNVHNACIHDMVLLWPEERSGTLKAATDGKLWEIHRRLYTRVLVKMSYERNMRRLSYMDAVTVLAVVSGERRLNCSDAMKSLKYREGDVIMKKGDVADGMYFLDSGEAELINERDERTILKRADYFGELALLTKSLRDATVVALTDCEVFYLESERFERVAGKLRVKWRERPDQFKRLCKAELGTETPDENIFR